MLKTAVFLICTALAGFAQTKVTASDWLIVPGRLWVRLSPPTSLRHDAVMGDGDFRSSHPEMQRLDPVIYDLFVEFAK